MGRFKDSNKYRPYYQPLAEMKAYSNFDFNAFVEKRDNHWFLKENNKRLVSFSSLTKLLDMNIYKENNFLNQRKEMGKKLMENLKWCFDNKVYDINNMLINEQEKKHINTVLRALADNNIQILAVEKLVCNDSFIGFVDCIVKWKKPRTRKQYICNLEIKLRNSLKQTPRDRMQVYLYHELNTLPPLILIINDFGDYDLDLSWFSDKRKWPGIKPLLNGLINSSNKYLTAMGESEWTLNPWKLAY